MSAPLTPDTLNTIRKNAGKVPPSIIADSLGWTLPHLERVARDRKIDLRLPPLHEPAPERSPLSADALNRPDRKQFWPDRVGRTEQACTRLFPADARAIEAAGSALGLRRGAALARLVENARARGLIEELVRLPAPMPAMGEEG